jgi:hypothetical protein
MPDRDNVLREQTYKDADTVGQRVYYTITEPKTRPASDAELSARLHRTTRAVSLLFERLHKDGVLSDDALDEILLELV